MDVLITDSTLRDGSHAIAHQFGYETAVNIASALDAAGVPRIEVSHGDGLAGSSYNFGFSATPELQLIRGVCESVRRAEVAALLLPGIGTSEDLRAAADVGITVARIATHCTEADVAVEHFGLARHLGLKTVGFLMMAHMIDPDDLAQQARIMADAGSQCVYIVDSAGAMVEHDVISRVQALRSSLGGDVEVGFHGHNNLGLGIANSVAAFRGGARQIDGATRGLGAGAGNAATELLVAVFSKMGIDTGIELMDVLAVSENLVAPVMARTMTIDRNAVVMGYMGVYSSFLLHALRVSERYGVEAYKLLVEAGRHGYVGGQEDMLVDIAVRLAGGEEREQQPDL